MFLLLSLAIAFPPQTHSGGNPPPFPTRAYQPQLIDPGLHGGRPKFLGDQDGNPGDLTPDGKVLVFYRKVWDPNAGFDPSNPPVPPGKFRSALQVAAFDPERLQTTDGNLSAFFSPGTGEPVGNETMWGTDYAVSDENESFFLHYSPHTLGVTDPNCSTCEQLDPNYLTDGASTATLTLALKPLVGHPAKGANPFPSDGAGNYDPNGTFKTYELWMVTTHFGIDPQYFTCGNGPETEWQCLFGVWTFRAKAPVRQEPILGCRDIQVIVDEAAQPRRVHTASAGTFTPLTIDLGPTHIIGTEPTITADGRLLVFHGDGGANLEARGKVTYAYNPNSCQAAGWRQPRSITALYEDAHAGAGDIALLRFGLAAYPIRGPANGGTTEHTYTAADTLNGPYPWIDKDGSFFMSAHTYSWEGFTLPDNPNTPGVFDPVNGRAVRSGIMVCGSITRGFIKHVDDIAVNPTRQGGNFDWPWTGDPAHDEQRDSQMTTFFSTGLKPGTWEPFFDQGVPVPTMQASQRIPILPIWSHRTRLYGEVRFEEADGNYLAYLACNEAFKKHSYFDFPSEVDVIRTPDSSGQDARSTCELKDGASFPQEAYGFLEHDPAFPLTQTVDRWNAEELRHNLSLADPLLQSHENIGFKGQAILFPTAGWIDVTGGQLFAGAQSPYGATGCKASFQAFVKPLRTWNAQNLTILKDAGHFELKLKTNGQFRADVTVMNGGISKTKNVQSRINAIGGQPNEFDPSVGWRHVLVTLDGDSNGMSVLRIYVDGLKEATLTWAGESHFSGPTTSIQVGPRVSGGAVDPEQAVLVLDEVAISRVVRTEEEIRRDAFVAPLPSEFEHTWPPQADYPIPAEWVARVNWPIGVAYDSDKVDLGRDLFSDPILSAGGNTTTCAACHESTHGFAELQQKASNVLVPNTFLPFNTPTVLNSAFGTHKMFNGRAASLEEQSLMPLVSGPEMGIQTIDDVLARLVGTSFDGHFVAIYGQSATSTTLAEVLAMYQRTLNSHSAAVDAFENPGFIGIPGVPVPPQMTASQKRGRALFFGKARCFGCHRGPAFTDDDFHNIHSVTDPLVKDRGELTGRVTEDGMVKTPTLRNVDKTKPYFHDGSKAELIDVVEHYDSGFLNAPGAIGPVDRNLTLLGLTALEKSDLVNFLKALSGSDPQ